MFTCGFLQCTWSAIAYGKHCSRAPKDLEILSGDLLSTMRNKVGMYLRPAYCPGVREMRQLSALPQQPSQLAEAAAG